MLTGETSRFLREKRVFERRGSGSMTSGSGWRLNRGMVVLLVDKSRRVSLELWYRIGCLVSGIPKLGIK